MNLSQNHQSEDGFSKFITDLTCRVCLNVEELMINIYDEIKDLQSNLVELLESCGGLVVDRLDDFPKYLCKVCASELLVAAKFREKCAKSNKLLNGVVIPKSELDNNTRDNINSQLLIIMCDSSDNDIHQKGTSSFNSLSDDILNEIIVEEVDCKEGNNFENECSIEETPVVQKMVTVQDLTVNRLEENTHQKEIIFEIPNNTSGKDNLLESNNILLQNFIISDFDESKLNLTETIPKRKQKVKTITNKRLKNAAPLIFDCEECGAAFSNHENLNRHYRRNHQEFVGKMKFCSNCMQAFTKQESLENHFQNVHKDVALNSKTEWNIKSRRETCSTCGRICISESSLKIHMRSHTGDRPFECSECHKTFKTKVAVTLHLKRHTGQLDWECEVCGKGFVESSNLKVHMRTHTGEKPHLCKICGKQFSRVFLLQLHLRTHTGEKPYKCVVCTKAYSQKCDLDIHFRSHTGMRPYVCQICFKGFNRNYALHKHERQHIQ